MARRTWFLAQVAACALLAGALGCGGGRSPARVTINSRSWFVDVAMTSQQRRRGLSGRSDLGADEGMLFVYPSQRVLEFCMRGCSDELDIAFIDSDLRVVKVHTMSVEPGLVGRAVYGSQVPAQYALEVAGGALRRAGVRRGDKVFFHGDIPDAAKAEGGL